MLNLTLFNTYFFAMSLKMCIFANRKRTGNTRPSNKKKREHMQNDPQTLIFCAELLRKRAIRCRKAYSERTNMALAADNDQSKAYWLRDANAWLFRAGALETASDDLFEMAWAADVHGN